jgi:2,4-dienoyl-CoA reductase (NADPH2)
MVAPPTRWKLFSPIAIGSMEVKNRIVMAPMTTDYAHDDQSPSPRLRDYLVARARGGAGLITVEACMIDRRHRETPRSLSLAEDASIAGHRALVDTLHAHGAKVQPQISHPGPDSLAAFYEGTPAVGPSVAVAPVSGAACRELSVEEIDAIVGQYGAAARRAQLAGYDGVELHAAHAYMLVGSFLSPFRNKRADAYGGRGLEARARFLLEVVRRMKAETQGDFPLTVRLSGYERVPGGRDIDETQRLAPALVEAGVNAFHVSGGVSDRLVSQIVRGAAHGDGHNVAAARAIKLVVDVPVIVVGRIHDPRLAEAILARGDADLIAMGRPLLADPELPAKARAGRFAEIRRCISCETCIDAMARGTMHCAVNPATGRERELAIVPAPQRKRVLVAGGGPAGMEAARVATLRGHDVTLCERERRLGGALVPASVVHPDNQLLLDHLTTAIATLPVHVELGRPVTAELVDALAPDVVIVATGGRVVVPSIPGDDLPHVLSAPRLRALLAGAVTTALAPAGWPRRALDVLGATAAGLLTAPRIRELSRLWMPLGKRVAIIGADLAAVELAEFLAERGRRVALLEAGERIAGEVGRKRRGEHMDHLDELGVTVNTGASCEEITRRGVVIRTSQGRRGLVEADSVILAGRLEASLGLFESVRETAPEAYAIGDCTGLGLIRKATEEAMTVACRI